MIKLIRTSSKHKDFIGLVKQLDAYLKIVDGDEHHFYNQFNGIQNLKHVVVAYLKDEPVACGAFKAFNASGVEIKRMFTKENVRGKGVATTLLAQLEDWARALNYNFVVLETGIRQTEAVQFYKKNNYRIIENYDPYKGAKNSLCFKKVIN